MSERIEQQYKELLEKAKNDDRIIGFILTGSRGKGMVTKKYGYAHTLESWEGYYFGK